MIKPCGQRVVNTKILCRMNGSLFESQVIIYYRVWPRVDPSVHAVYGHDGGVHGNDLPFRYGAFCGKASFSSHVHVHAAYPESHVCDGAFQKLLKEP
jgi:hypothetical protein